MPRPAAQFTLFAVAVAGSLLLAEGALRLFFHAAPQLEADIYRRDEAGRLALRPDIRRRHVTPYWDFEIRLNDAGMRSNRPAPADGSTVWLGLGDSFAFGWGVSLDETFYARLAGALDAPVVNAAVPGTGPIDQLERLEVLADRWRIPVTLVALFVGNDFTDVALGGSAQFNVVDGLLEHKPLLGEPAPGDWRRWLARRSHLAQLLRALQFNWIRGSSGPPRTWDAWMREFAQIHLARPNERTLRAELEVLVALDGMRAVARRGGGRLALLVVPRSIQVYPAEAGPMREALGLAPADLDLDRPQRLLADWASERGVLRIDPLERLRREASSGARLYYTPDAHMTAEGHRVVAEEAVEVLRAVDLPR